MVGLAVLSALLLGTSWLEGGSPAYGLSYEGPRRRPEAPQPEADSLGLVACLDAWQKRQEGPAPWCGYKCLEEAGGPPSGP